MPTTWNGMTRLLVDGVPVWKNGEGDLFFYDQDLARPPLKVGTVAGGFSEGWADALAERLAAYRVAAAPRARATAAARKQN